MLGLASFAIVEVNVAGLLVMGLAVLMLIADIKVPGHGVLTVGGVISFIFGPWLIRRLTFHQIGADGGEERLLRAIHLTINGLAAGLRNSG